MKFWNNYNDFETVCSLERRDLVKGTSTALDNENGPKKIEPFLFYAIPTVEAK